MSALSIIQTPAATAMYTLSLHDALPISTLPRPVHHRMVVQPEGGSVPVSVTWQKFRSEEHTSELQSRGHLVCRLLPEKKNADRPIQQPVSTERGRTDTAVPWVQAGYRLV